MNKSGAVRAAYCEHDARDRSVFWDTYQNGTENTQCSVVNSYNGKMCSCSWKRTVD